MNPLIYKCLDNSMSWECLQCGMPNFSSSFFDESLIRFSLTNSFSPLTESTNSDQLGTPLATSSPVVETSTGNTSNNTKKRKPLRLLNVNCQSITPKRGEFQNMVDSTKPDIIVATETWLEQGKHQDGEIGQVNKFCTEYKIYRRDRKDGYGGVFVAVSNNIISERADELETEAEMVWVKLSIKGTKTLYISGFYRPHENDERALSELKVSLERISAYPKAHIWLVGDLNFPGIDWEGKVLKPNCNYPTLHQDFLDTLVDNGMDQLVNEPTRGENILDLFATNNPTLINKVQVIPGISDHQAVLIEGELSPTLRKQQKRQVPLYGKANWDGFKEYINSFGKNFDKLDTTPDVDKLWSNFKATLESGIKKFIPHRMARRKQSIPWLSGKIKRLIKKRDAKYKESRKDHTGKSTKAFKHLKAEVQRETRRAYWSYVEEMVCPATEPDKPPSAGKKFWTYIKHCKQDSCGVAPLLGEDGLRHDEAGKKAEILNKQFTSVFSNISPLTLAQTAAQKLRIQPGENPAYTSPHSCMPDFSITVNGVAKLLKDLKPHKAAGPDNIRPLILKELYHEISPILCFIFQISKNTGKIPGEWKRANVVPIYKKGPRHLAENYRPVSLTCICCKLMEHIMSKNIMTHLETNNILQGKQHGFRARLSCETQLLELVEELHRNMEAGQQTDIVVMDFSKAFDKVSHARLLYKLQWYGIRGPALDWINSFLTNRTQQVVVDGVESQESWVTSGVPQGSVLGPILFLIYINDLPEYVKSNVRLFADDTILYRSIKSERDSRILQDDLDRLVDWERDWLMEFHPGKCQVIRVSRSKRPRTTTYTLHGHQLETVEHTKYLGVTISKDLSWNKHIDQVCSKAGKTLGMVKRNIKVSQSKIKGQAFNSIVRPVMEYSCAVWDPYTDTNIRRLEMFQRRAARWTLNRYHLRDSVTEMLEELGWPTLQTRRAEARLCLMYKMVHNLVAINVGLYTTPVHRPTRRTHPYSFIQIQPNTEAYRMSYFPQTIVEWNLLPTELVTAPTIEAFKAHLVSARAPF
jgi:hypothetical protein